MRSDGTVRVLLARGDDFVRRVLSRTIDDHTQLSVVGTAARSDDVLRAASEVGPDVVLIAPPLDDAVPGELCRAVKAHRPESRVLVLLSSAQDESAGELQRAGAAGVVLMSLDPLPLYAAILAVAAGAVPPLVS